MFLEAFLPRSPVTGKSALVVGDDALALCCLQRGYRTAFLPDQAFATKHDKNDPDRKAKLDAGAWDFDVIAEGGFRAYLRQMENAGIRHAGEGITDSFYFAVGYLRGFHGRDLTYHPRSWDCLFVNTDMWSLHPSFFTVTPEEGDFFDLLALARLLVPGGFLAFREIACPFEAGSSNARHRWRTDWKSFFGGGYFQPVDSLKLGGARYVIAKRDDSDLFPESRRPAQR
jgi:hypothetical protein